MSAQRKHTETTEYQDGPIYPGKYLKHTTAHKTKRSIKRSEIKIPIEREET